MMKFLDGPAAGSRLSLRRAPYLLRVVIDESGKVDALDQLDDTVRPGETAHVYYQSKEVARALVCSRGKGCRMEITAEYRHFQEQPSQEVLTDNQAWVEWATRTGEQLLGASGK